MWCNPWLIKELVKNLFIYGTIAITTIYILLFTYAKITYKIYKAK